MKEKFFRGDRWIWAMLLLICIFSFLPSYSASANLVYGLGRGTTWGYLLKHTGIFFSGFMILFFIHKVHYKYFGAFSVLLLPIVIFLLIVTLFTGTKIEGVNAARWIRIPLLGMKFQTSTLAILVMMVYVAWYLSRIKDLKNFTFVESFWKMWTPVLLTCFLIYPANFSTAFFLFLMVCMLLFVGGYPLKFLLYFSLIAIVLVSIFLLIAKAFPEFPISERLGTWINRISFFFIEETEGYQIENAKIALSEGGLLGRGPGNSAQKYFLPQSTSDFIFPIIVEEYGLVGAFVTLFCYMFLLYRFFRVAKSCTTQFSRLLVVAVGFPLIFQAIINLLVATDFIPVTGQPLPFFSSGGTSVWINFIAIGIILSVSAHNYENQKKQISKQTH